jgi:stalled ribosome rescue protein Dom34
LARRRKKKRGYSLAILVGFDQQIIHFWKLYSQRFKLYKRLTLPKKWKNCDDKQHYHYHEDIIDVLRPLIHEGVKSILLADLPDNDFTDRFLEHITKHHRWLIRSKRKNQVSFGQIKGKASSFKEVRWLLDQEKTQKILKSITLREGDLLIAQLEKTVNTEKKKQKVFYGLKELETLIYMGGKKDDSASKKVDYLIMTDNYLNEHKQKGRIYRLKQIAENKGINTKILPEESHAGARIQEFGGILAFKK